MTAFMSMMDMADHNAGLCEAARVLRPGGFLQFSILHQCFVPPHRKVLREPDGTTRAIEIGGYFDTIDGRIDTFLISGCSCTRPRSSTTSRPAANAWCSAPMAMPPPSDDDVDVGALAGLQSPAIAKAKEIARLADQALTTNSSGGPGPRLRSRAQWVSM